MNFRDEYETELHGELFFVAVQGRIFDNDEIEILSLLIQNHLGEILDQTDERYETLKDEAEQREYDVEVHETDFAFYDDHTERFF